MKIKNYKKFINENFVAFDYGLNDNDDPKYLINKVDYTLLRATATKEEIIDLCKTGDRLGVKSVCVLPEMVKTAADALKDSKVLVCTVISFPKGTNSTEEKIRETKQAIANGADEIDMVMNYQLLTSGKDAIDKLDDYEDIENEIKQMVELCHSHKNKKSRVTLKVIVESGMLNKDQTGLAIDLCDYSGADFIKTSTGFAPVGAELDKVKLMYDTIEKSGSIMKIKVSGGIRTLEDIEKFKPYADRFGIGRAAVDSIFNVNFDTEEDTEEEPNKY